MLNHVWKIVITFKKIPSKGGAGLSVIGCVVPSQGESFGVPEVSIFSSHVLASITVVPSLVVTVSPSFGS